MNLSRLTNWTRVANIVTEMHWQLEDIISPWIVSQREIDSFRYLYSVLSNTIPNPRRNELIAA
jgi:hypothetical protein